MSACRSLELYLRHKACDRPVSLALVDATTAARQRITSLKVRGCSAYNIARVVQELAARLPALEELEFRGPADGAAWPAVARTQLIMCTIADLLPRLRRLVLPLPPDVTAPAGLGALAACAQLRELTMRAFGGSERLALTQAALEGLTQLQQLEHLTLDRFRLRAGDEELVTQLLTTHRPPNLLTLTLLQYSLPFLEVDFERAAGAGARPEGRRGMRCVAFKSSPIVDCTMQCADQLARAVLAAANRLKQLTVPELAFGRLRLSDAWRPPQYLQPGDPLPRLLARCGRVELGSLCVGYSSVWDDARDLAPVLAVVRLMGLPRSLDLAHGCWQPQAQALAQEPASCGAVTRQVARLQRQLNQGLRPQQLQLDSATPEQVLITAVEELAAEAAQAGANRGCSGGVGGGAAGGRLVLLRSALPPRDAGSMGWEAWMKGAVEHCVRLAVQERARQQPERSRGGGGAPLTAGPPGLVRELERSAAELAALLSGAAGASSAERRGEAGSARAATAVVLTGMWARSQQGGGGGGGTGANPGDGGGGGDRQVSGEEALRQLLVLDHGARRLWASVWKPFRAESDSDDPGTDDDHDYDDGRVG
ncbi:hypothetical protein HXX76_015939 [Chlamydomonas incerta]|uniref:Uncharacterized protein n=1 Tax=Chlamydomonas incerta TaxID=51695 RepID=A0A835S920_CHLIN|nr:hypothetical protein HXX76_015939 [Chlamydomonas incerta]|eukprot:KAG2422559.1 hypothetical protein HXX76_015939 [Chlamydomonas incerta]